MACQITLAFDIEGDTGMHMYNRKPSCAQHIKFVSFS